MGSTMHNSFRYMQCHLHGPMSHSAEHRALPDEGACLIWGERDFGGLTLLGRDHDVQVLELQSVSDVLAGQHEHNWNALLQRDFSGSEGVAFRRNLDALRSILSICLEVLAGKDNECEQHGYIR
jgi:hypothetical protein